VVIIMLVPIDTNAKRNRTMRGTNPDYGQESKGRNILLYLCHTTFDT